MSSLDERSAASTTTSVRGYLAGVGDVLVLELKQRLRSRGWYIMLGVWVLLIGIVCWLTWASWTASQVYRPTVDIAPEQAGPGSMIFEVVLAFVLLFALLVAPALSANSINGDRAGGTLAILQVTLLTPGQILWGKFFAAWIAALAFLVTSSPFLVFSVTLSQMTPGHVFISLLMLALEFAVVCGIGVGVSALAGRPLFSIVVTYLTVAGLVVGTLIAFGLGVGLVRGTIMANQPSYLEPVPLQSSGSYQPPSYTCQGELTEVVVPRTERVAWLLAMNPYVVVADAVPYPDRNLAGIGYGYQGAIESISQGARAAMAGPEGTYPCANGKPQPAYLEQETPLWPLGLGLQVALAGLLLWLGWRSLRTPAVRLPRGSRIA